MNKRIIISESERQSILNLHTSYKNKLNEQEANTPPASGGRLGRLRQAWKKPVTEPVTEPAPAPAPAPVVTDRKVDCTSTKNPTRCKQKVLDVQVKINDKCKTITQKLVEDGIFGNNTYNSIKTCTGMDLSSAGRAAAIKAATPAGDNAPTTTTTTVALVAKKDVNPED